MIPDKQASPVADWVDLVILLGACLLAFTALGALDGEAPGWAVKLFAAAIFAAAFGLRRWLGLGPAPRARSLGLVGALGTVAGLGLVIAGVAWGSPAEPDPAPLRVDAAVRRLATGYGEFWDGVVASAEARAAECEKAGGEKLACRTAQNLPELEEIAAREREKDRQRNAELDAKFAAINARSAQQDRDRRPEAAALVGFGVLLIAGVWWQERRARR